MSTCKIPSPDDLIEETRILDLPEVEDACKRIVGEIRKNRYYGKTIAIPISHREIELQAGIRSKFFMEGWTAGFRDNQGIPEITLDRTVRSFPER